MAYEIEWHGSVVYVRLYGEVSVRELADAVAEIAADPAFERQRYHVVDYAEATLPPLDPRVFDAIAPAIGATVTNPDITAIVLPDNAQTRAFAAFCAPMLGGLQSVEFMQDRAQADAWIRERAGTSAA